MKNYIIILLAIVVSTCSCRKDDIVTTEIEEADYSDWTTASHGWAEDPSYDIVFNQTEVLRFDIEIAASNWESMQNDLEQNLGGSGGGPGGGPGGESTSSDYDPVFVPCSFHFNGTEWYNVGIRYKGNSSLSSAYMSGNNKLSFKLDFDEFEDEAPSDYTNQRFYGFRQLNLNNNFDDASLLREKVGADLFREFGLVSAQTAFCVVYINYGEGAQYFGVYTIVEEVDDTVLEDQLSMADGNLYKPDGDAASFAQGTFDEGEMEKKSNIEAADYSDVMALYDALNSEERLNHPETWKSNLEELFNVDGFMKWLAANTAMQNWDTYGVMTHNYYLYNNPSDQKLTWIPWDNNEALQEGKLGGALSLSLNEVGSNWPLISYLMDVEEYEELYEAYLNQFVEEVFEPNKMIQTYTDYYSLLKEDADMEESGYTYISYDGAFDRAVDELKDHVQDRTNAVQSYLNK